MIGHSNKQTDRDYYFLYVIYFYKWIKKCACTHPNFFTIAKLYVRMLKIILKKGFSLFNKNTCRS